MDKFNPKKFERAEEAFRLLRRDSQHYKAARVDVGAEATWAPTKFNPGKDYGSGCASKTRVIKLLQEYMRKACVGGMDALRGDTIGIWYMIMGDIRLECSLGSNTSGIRGRFEWSGFHTIVSLHSGVNTRLALTEGTSTILAHNLTERSKLQKATGWDTLVVQAMSVDDITTLGNLVRSAAGGHNKITRLVKGMMLYIDLLHDGRQEFNGLINNIIPYQAAQVLASFRARGRSHAFCSKPSSVAYIVLMHLVGQRYPFNAGGLVCRGNAVIPADSQEHYVVVRGAVGGPGYRCTLTPASVWTGIVCYAREMEVSDQLEEAMIIACSLYENRYLREVGLPKVESTVDLIRPMFNLTRTDDSEKPIIDADAAIVVGRVHQMGCLLMAKDMIISAQHSTSATMPYTEIVTSYLQSQETVVNRMVEWVSPVSLVSAAPSMKWLSKLNGDDIRDIDKFSIFEGLWLCGAATKSVERGGISCLVRGTNDRMQRNGYMNLLDSELGKFGTVLDRSRVPAGKFSVRLRCFVSEVDDDRLNSGKWRTVKAALVRSCEYRASKEPDRLRLRVLRSRNKGKLERSETTVDTVMVEKRQSESPEQSVVIEKTEEVKLVGKETPFSEAGAVGTATRPKYEVRDDALGREEHGVRARKWKKMEFSDEDVEDEVVKKGREFVGAVNANWSAEVMLAISKSATFSKFMAGLGLDSETTIFGEPGCVWYAKHYDEIGIRDNAKVLFSTFRDSNTKVPISEIIALLKGDLFSQLECRNPVSIDSMSDSRLGIGDGYIADWMYKQHGMLYGISKKDRGRLARQFWATKIEQATIKRIFSSLG